MSKEKVIIDLCSSDEEEEEDEDFDDENNCEEELEETDEEEEEDTSLSEDDSDWSDDDATDSDVEYDRDDETCEKGDDDDDDDKVIRLLTAGSDLKPLKVTECKAYLRKNGLRLSGTKALLIERIVEHWRIKDGTGEALYPRSSFAINCKGDVCKGDTVLFTQKVHNKYEKMKGSGKVVGRRTIAGKVVKESYGTAKQQHTFTIEVLWCEGIQKLPPLYPLLVKGRNLYRLMTLRQRWANEEDRVKVLSEKHSRGAAARKIMRERKIKSGYVLKDGRLQKPGHVKKPCQVKTRTNKQDENQTQMFRQDIPANHSQGHKNPTQLRNMNPPFHSHNSHTYAPPPPGPLTYAPRPQGPRLSGPRPSGPLRYASRPQSPRPPGPLTYAPRPQGPPPPGPLTYAPFNVYHSHLPRPNIPPAYSAQQNQSIQRPPPAFYSGRPISNALQGQATFNPHVMQVTHQRRPYQNHHTYHGSSNSGYNYGVRDLDHFSNMMISRRGEGDTYRQSENTHIPYKNHQTYHSNSNNGYNYGASDLTSHRREGDAHKQSRETYRPNYR